MADAEAKAKKVAAAKKKVSRCFSYIREELSLLDKNNFLLLYFFSFLQIGSINIKQSHSLMIA